MKKLSIIITLALVIVVGSFTGVGTAKAVDYAYCSGVGQLNGWWGTITPSTKLCTTIYYTWNTNTGIGDEESWMISTPLYDMCHRPSGNPTYYNNMQPGAYIPSPDSSQTSAARYYRWNNGSDWSYLGSIDQYNTFGWGYVASTTWAYVDRFKLTDYTTGSESLYSKHVDLDSYKVTNCP